MAKDYYLVLGIGPDATPDEVRSAYRRKAKKCHPDCTGEGSEPFLAIQEAYEVLGDASRRRAYDDKMARGQPRGPHAARAAKPEPIRRGRCPVEPLVPDQRRGGVHHAFSESSFSSLIAELFERPWSGQHIPMRPQAGGGLEDLHVEVSLTREHALHGGRIRVWVPVEIVCPACRGRGGFGLFECLQCSGSGTLVDDSPVDIALPADLVDGSEGRVSLSRPGRRYPSLILHFRVTDR